MLVIFITIVMSAKKDKSGKRRQGPLQIVVTGNMAIVAFQFQYKLTRVFKQAICPKLERVSLLDTALDICVVYIHLYTFELMIELVL